jgi:hypothetical protein
MTRNHQIEGRGFKKVKIMLFYEKQWRTWTRFTCLGFIGSLCYPEDQTSSQVYSRQHPVRRSNSEKQTHDKWLMHIATCEPNQIVMSLGLCGQGRQSEVIHTDTLHQRIRALCLSKEMSIVQHVRPSTPTSNHCFNYETNRDVSGRMRRGLVSLPHEAPKKPREKSLTYNSVSQVVWSATVHSGEYSLGVFRSRL